MEASRVRRPGGDQVIPRPTQVWVRPYHPWRNLDQSVLADVEQVLSKVHEFSRTYTPLAPRPDVQVSAVLVGLFQGPRGAEVILTRRSKAMRSHMGEISFPGGRLDADETPRDAALREAHEEIGLHPREVEVVGQLAPGSTKINANHIVPVVGRVLRAPSLEVRNVEVDRVFTVPLSELAREDTYSEEHWGSPPQQWQIHFFHLDDETVWGATARMLHQLISIALA